MSQDLWSAVDEYVEASIIGADPVLDEAIAASAAAGLPEIAVTPAQGKLLHMLARIHGAGRILEVGTLGGYSAIWLARALPDGGSLLSLELDPRYAAVARENLARAGMAGRTTIRVGPAMESLQALVAEDAGPFDLIFIDADKANTPGYFELALGLSRPGGLIISDNVVRGGALADPDTPDPGAQGMRRFHTMLGSEPRVSATTIQTVGRKGYDGFTLVRVGS